MTRPTCAAMHARVSCSSFRAKQDDFFFRFAPAKRRPVQRGITVRILVPRIELAP